MQLGDLSVFLFKKPASYDLFSLLLSFASACFQMSCTFLLFDSFFCVSLWWKIVSP